MNFFKNYPLSLITGLIIIYISLFRPPSIPEITILPIGLDKLVHSGIYLFFTGIIIYESRINIVYKKIYLLALFPFLWGVGMEILQDITTDYRTGSVFDIVFNSIGIICCLLAVRFIKPVKRIFFHKKK